MPVPRHVMEQIKRIIPPLNGTLHKGQSGRVAVLGGALDYTGAPYFAAMSALRVGVDLSHVICSPTAAGAIKSYAPDLMVHPILREDASEEQVKPELSSLLERLHVLVIGPGLGREPYMQKYASLALSLARERGMFVVLDADGLFMVGKDPSKIRGYRRAVLTPNVAEFKRLADQVGLQDEDDKKSALAVSRALGGVCILQKGASDVIAIDTTGEAADAAASKVEGSDENAKEEVQVDTEGGYKRCGGQGDVLSGSVGAMLAFGKCYETGAFGDRSIPASRMPLLAAVAGSVLTRASSKEAFHKEGRALITEHIIPEIGKAFTTVFGDTSQVL